MDNNKPYLAQCQNPFTGARGYIGCFYSPEEAHQAYLNTKSHYAKQLASDLEDERVAEAILKRYYYRDSDMIWSIGENL